MLSKCYENADIGRLEMVFTCFPVDTGRNLNVHKTFRRRPGRLLNVLCTFNLRPVSTGLTCFADIALIILFLVAHCKYFV